MSESFSASKISSPSAILLIIRIEYPMTGKPVSTNCTGFQTDDVGHRSAPQDTEVINDFSVFCGACGYSYIPPTDGVLSGPTSLGYNPPIQFPTFPSLPIFYPATIPTIPQ